MVEPVLGKVGSSLSRAFLDLAQSRGKGLAAASTSPPMWLHGSGIAGDFGLGTVMDALMA
jgi:hypothetical protein